MSPPQFNSPHDYEQYALLTDLLHPNPPKELEIDILPSSLYADIQYADSSIGIPKKVLIQCYLHARNILFREREGGDQESGSGNTDDAQRIKGKRKGTWKGETSNEASADDILRSTSVILLWDPNHTTAANWRKRHLLSLPDANSNSTSAEESPPTQTFPTAATETSTKTSAIHADLSLLTSLLISPLKKHTKSSTLWTHRLFLIQNFLHHFPSPQPHHPPPTTPTAPPQEHPHPHHHMLPSSLWTTELSIILRAAERHPRNYYAWNYARLLLTYLLDGRISREQQGAVVVMETVRRVHKWTLLHPGDVSGWAFLAFLLRWIMGKGGDGGGGGEHGIGVEGWRGGAEDEVRRVVVETREWVRKFGWRGESVEWFFREAGGLFGAECDAPPLSLGHVD